MQVVRAMNGKKLHLSHDAKTTNCGLPATPTTAHMLDFLNARHEPITSREGRCGSCVWDAVRVLNAAA